MKTKGKLIISLDFELFWGVFDIYSMPNKEYFDNTLSAIPKLIELLNKYNIHATWASVGMLFNENKDEWMSNHPETKPNYSNQKLNAYKHGEENINKSNEKYYFAPNIVKDIIDAPNQELASHTYSHYYCLEDGQTQESFEQDLYLAIKLFKKFNKEPKTLIFPRNQYNPNYNHICSKYNISNLRTNPDNWYWKKITPNSLYSKGKLLISRSCRLLDTYFNIDIKSYPQSKIIYNNDIHFQQASRFLRPISSTNLLNKLRKKRVFQEMEYAAKNNQIYHLWFHPHNFGVNTEESLIAFEEILIKYKELNNEYNFSSSSMKDLLN